MKFEVLKRSHVKRNILIGVIIVLILNAVILTFTRAKYRVTQSVPLVSGTINYSAADLNLVAMYLNQGGALPEGQTDIAPKFGYTLNEEQSTCEVNDSIIEDAKFTYENGMLGFYNLNRKGTKCTVYFDLIPDSENPVISNLMTTSDDTSITVTITATDNIGIYYYYFQLDSGEEIKSEEASYTFEGLEKDSIHTITVRVVDAAGNAATDSDEVTVGLRAEDIILASENAPTEQTTDWTGQTTYYYTGNPNNWVQFGGFWWRIIRINGDGSIRVIYQGTSANTTGERTQIGVSEFNLYSNKTYVGLVYDGISQHGYGTNSTIMNTLNNWYNDNIENDSKDLHYEQYIDTGVGFCSDRNMASRNYWTDRSFYYAPYDRINGGASLQCNNEDILSQDNGKLPNPIGLITSDEVVLTGITWNDANTGSYLYTNTIYWTMSPYHFNGNGANVFRVDSNGFLSYYFTDQSYGVRPVINLRADVSLTGSGTTTDPFKVVGAE